MDKFTFGSSKAAVNLADILTKHAENGNWRTGNIVSSHLVALTEKLHTVSDCNLPISLKRWVIHSLYDSFKISLERYFSDKPTAANALTHALNVGKAKYLNALKLEKLSAAAQQKTDEGQTAQTNLISSATAWTDGPQSAPAGPPQAM